MGRTELNVLVWPSITTPVSHVAYLHLWTNILSDEV